MLLMYSTLLGKNTLSPVNFYAISNYGENDTPILYHSSKVSINIPFIIPLYTALNTPEPTELEIHIVDNSKRLFFHMGRFYKSMCFFSIRHCYFVVV